MPDLLRVPAIFVAILFLYSGIGKLGSQQTFVQSLLLVPFLPHQLSGIVGASIPVIEILIGALLFWNVGSAKVAAIILLATFAFVALLAARRNQQVPCNCFGTENSEFLSMATVIRNIALALVLAPTLNVSASKPELFVATYALVAFFLFMSVLKTARNGREYQQLQHGTQP